eukprot:10556083-Lingulodinium_polyedra.AAC.1
MTCGHGFDRVAWPSTGVFDAVCVFSTEEPALGYSGFCKGFRWRLYERRVCRGRQRELIARLSPARAV